MLSAAVTSFLAAPLAFLGILQPAGAWWPSLILISLSYGLLNMYYGLVYASIQDIVAPALRGTSMAIYFMAMYLCGASFGPLITGRLSDTMARRAAELAGSAVMTDAFKAIGLREAMYIVPLLSVALALVLYAGSRTIIADMARRDREMELQVSTTT
jgi:MFS family permease